MMPLTLLSRSLYSFKGSLNISLCFEHGRLIGLPSIVKRVVLMTNILIFLVSRLLSNTPWQLLRSPFYIKNLIVELLS